MIFPTFFPEHPKKDGRMILPNYFIDPKKTGQADAQSVKQENKIESNHIIMGRDHGIMMDLADKL